MKELLTRSITGLVYGLLLVGSVILHPLAFFVVYLALTLLCVNEFSMLNKKEGKEPQRASSLIFAGTVFIIPFIIHFFNLPSKILIVIPLMVLLVFVIEMFQKRELPFSNIAMTLLGIIYIALPMSLTNELVYNPYSDSYTYQLLIFLLMVLWVNDTGAYLTGRILGKHKLFERISPKKTWEGLIGGFVIAFIVTALFGRYFSEIPRSHQWVITASIVIFGTFGDLVESMWKRSMGLKDSGKALPGHGGWLDRLDSILFAVPAVFICVIILNAF